ncbi:MAG: metal ABC transporter ATP-binding protein [Thermomicrobiales bacterium]
MVALKRAPVTPATASASDLLVELRDVCFGYGGEPTLEDVNLQVRRGEFVGLIGPNGSGKSTLLKIILGLLRPVAGTVRLFGQDTARFDQRWRIGYVPQRLMNLDAQFPATVEEVVGMGRFARLGLFRRPGAADRAAVEQALAAVDMRLFRHRRIGQLSIGQQQRAFIARALATDAELLILDEPTAAVDAATQEEFYHLLEHLNRDFGLTIVLVEHDLAMVAAHVASIALLNRRIVFRGTPEEFATRDFLHGIYAEQTTCEVHPNIPHVHAPHTPAEHRHPRPGAGALPEAHSHPLRDAAPAPRQPEE